MNQAGRNIWAIMPLLFGLGFVAPLLVQTGVAPALAHGTGGDPLWLALAVGGAWGAITCIRGRWL